MRRKKRRNVTRVAWTAFSQTPTSQYLIIVPAQTTMPSSSPRGYIHRAPRWCYRNRFILAVVFFLLFILWSFDVDKHDRKYQAWVASHPQIASRIQLQEESSWNCTGPAERNRMCTVKNLCIDRWHGAYVMVRDPSLLLEPPPKVNLITAGNPEDMYWGPAVRSFRSFWHPFSDPYVDFVQDTLFVYGLYSPFHFSHQLYNGMIPLYSVMKDYNATKTSWTYRPLTFWFQPHTFDIDFITSGKDIVHNKKEISTHHQILPPKSTPICFANAVIGNGNRCSHWYCDGQIPTKHFNQFRDDIFDFYVDHNHWRKTTAHSPEHDLNCTHHIKIRPPTQSTLEEPPTIGLLNRVGSRHVTNMPELLESLQSSISYARFKLIEFDSGCSLPATAFLMRDIDILIAPFGNGLGAGIFMRPNRVLISINARWYGEDWFFWVTSSMGKRIFNFECLRSSCQEQDPELAKKILANHNIELGPEDLAEFINTDHRPDSLLARIAPDNAWEVYGQYGKDVKRKADVERLVPFVAGVAEEMVKTGEKWAEFNDNLDYPDMCRNGKCCGPECQGPMNRNVFGQTSAWGLLDGAGVNWVFEGNV